MAASVCELKWISYLLHDFGISCSLPIALFCDNIAALHITANPVFHEHTKHIEIDCHVVCDAYKDGFVSPTHVRGTAQLADKFTKALPSKSFASLISKLGMVSLDPSPTCGGMWKYMAYHWNKINSNLIELELMQIYWKEGEVVFI
ncbi:Retrovirus-related Pol polyprotein from transposon RE2 [Sesamum angolense]|uniref:Retrovirus-related Pol polyprotein from transposon RE2 n=1 Tax=Sesamum angolense TaxID=2727404 RepID=A0AAE1WB81_9LAMI|nr:Retrovirus-related Pol polyprotein from transposon RE2 [Sesamum angolense]